MSESIRKRVVAIQHARVQPWRKSALLHAHDIVIHSTKPPPSSAMNLVVVENFDAMKKDIDHALADEDFRKLWDSGQVSFFIWDGHDENAEDVKLWAQHLTDSPCKENSCTTQCGTRLHLMDNAAASGHRELPQAWEDRSKRDQYLRQILHEQWKQQKTKCAAESVGGKMHFVLCTPPTAVLYIHGMYTGEKGSKYKEDTKLFCALASLPIQVDMEKWVSCKLKKGSFPKSSPAAVMQIETSTLLPFFKKHASQAYCIDHDALVSFSAKRRKTGVDSAGSNVPRKRPRVGIAHGMSEEENAKLKKARDEKRDRVDRRIQQLARTKTFFEKSRPGGQKGTVLDKVSRAYGKWKRERLIREGLDGSFDEFQMKNTDPTIRNHIEEMQKQENQEYYFQFYFLKHICGTEARGDDDRAATAVKDMWADDYTRDSIRKYLGANGDKDHISKLDEKACGRLMRGENWDDISMENVKRRWRRM
jgi:hypothetical protein